MIRGMTRTMLSRVGATTGQTTAWTRGSLQKYFSTHYLESHEFVKVDGENGVVGITDFAQRALGDIVYVELPEVGESFDAGESFGSVESVKAASDVYMPVSGEIVAINETLEENPGLVNDDCMGEGWFIKIKIADQDEVSGILDDDSYQKFCDEQEE